MPSPFLTSRGLGAPASALAMGRTEEAASSLPRRNGAPALTVLARLELLAGNPDRAVILAEEACANARDDTEALVARALRATAKASAHRPIERFEIAEIARVEPELLPEVAIDVATACTAAGDTAAAERWLAMVEPSDAHLFARHRLLRARACAARADVTGQMQLIAQAVERLRPRAREESALMNEAVRTYCRLMREVMPTSDMAVVRDEPVLNDAARCELLRARAWIGALHGEYESAIETVMRASLHAGTKLAHIGVHLDLAAIAVANGDAHAPFTAAALKTACASADSHCWDDASLDDAIVLPQLLHLAAETHNGHLIGRCEHLAGTVLERHRSRSSLQSTKAYEAMLHEARALACAHKDERISLQAARQAFQAYEELSHSWRAGRVALFIYQCTGRREWMDRAGEHLAAFPESRYYRLLHAGNALRLTRRQQEVLDAVLHGKSPVQIAAVLGIAEETVRKHLKPVMRHFGVRTRLQLLAKFQHSTSSEPRSG